MQRSSLQFPESSDRRGHTDERVVDINRTERADLLHVIRSAARNRTEIEDGAQGLEITHAIITKLRRERVRIVIKPGGLNIHHHSEPRRLFHRFPAHEIRMADARMRWADTCGF